MSYAKLRIVWLKIFSKTSSKNKQYINEYINVIFLLESLFSWTCYLAHVELSFYSFCFKSKWYILTILLPIKKGIELKFQLHHENKHEKHQNVDFSFKDNWSRSSTTVKYKSVYMFGEWKTSGKKYTYIKKFIKIFRASDHITEWFSYLCDDKPECS
jgi:hypothetical protein